MNSQKKQQRALRVYHGEIRHSFLSPEFLDYPRGPFWYLTAGLIGVIVLTIGILTHTITLTLAFLLFVAVYWLLHTREARMLDVAITRHGIRIEDEFTPFSDIKEFWIIHDPPFVADLKLQTKRKFNPIITIHIFGQDPLALRQLLDPHVEEVEREEAFTDLLVRALRL
ncbi:MAG: hypothetical protein ABIH35_01590 [Patescibacteria group bacterium]